MTNRADQLIEAVTLTCVILALLCVLGGALSGCTWIQCSGRTCPAGYVLVAPYGGDPGVCVCELEAGRK